MDARSFDDANVITTSPHLATLTRAGGKKEPERATMYKYTIDDNEKRDQEG